MWGKIIVGFSPFWSNRAAEAAAGSAAVSGLGRFRIQLLDDIGYRDWLLQSSASEKVGERRWENVTEPVNWLEKLEKDERHGGRLEGLLGYLSLMDTLERQDQESNDDRVVPMALHAAKGLECPQVFRVGREEELLPHRSSIADDDIAEERRLAYVGLTRAQRKPVMTCAERRRRGGEKVRCEPSRFLSEVPQDDLQWEGAMRSCPMRRSRPGVGPASLDSR